jgi:RNA recognition motif-containing protein
MENQLYVGNLAGDVGVSTVQELFETYGFVMDVKLTAREAGRAHGSALVTMATDEAAEAAIRVLNRTSLHGLVIWVEAAAERHAGSGGAA